MQQDVLLAIAGAAIVLVIALLWLWRSLTRSPSQQAHEAAQDRDPPVEIGETYTFGITEFSDHHSGERVAVGKVEGFVIFAEDVPSQADVGDVVRAKVLSFNKGETSADATVIEVE